MDEDGDVEELGLTDADTELDGEIEADGLVLADADELGLSDADGLVDDPAPPGGWIAINETAHESNAPSPFQVRVVEAAVIIVPFSAPDNVPIAP